MVALLNQNFTLTGISLLKLENILQRICFIETEPCFFFFFFCIGLSIYLFILKKSFFFVCFVFCLFRFCLINFFLVYGC